MTAKAQKKITVIAAHPDDEVLGCGATLALRKMQGWETHLLIMTKGIGGRSKAGEEIERLRIHQEKLQTEVAKVADVLGFSSIHNFDFPDNRMDTVGRMDVALAIKEQLAKVRPDVIFTHHPGDYNWDHTITFDAVLMAARHSPGEYGPEHLYAFEVPSSTERGNPNSGSTFRPTTYVDVRKTIDKKKLALSYYATEARAYPHPRSAEALEYLARKRGYEVGLEYAEAFELIRGVERG